MDGFMEMEVAGIPMPMLLLGVGAVFVVLLLGLALTASNDNSAKRRRRTNAVMRRAKGEYVEEDAQQAPRELRIKTSDSSFGVVDMAVKRFVPRPDLLRYRLGRTGKNIKLGEYVMAVFIAIMAFTFLIKQFIGLPLAASALFGLVMGLLVPHFVVGRMIAGRRAKFTKLFPEAIDLLVRGLKSGLPITESMTTVGNEMAAPVGTEFHTITEQIKFGKSVDEALWAAAERIGMPEFKFFVISLAIQRETGGNLAETLTNLSDILRKRAQAKLKIKALSSEARASALIIGSLPFVMFFLLNTISAGYSDPLLYDSRGQVLLAIGLLWLFCGFAAMAKMVRFEI